jgi:hypothetical protein
MHQDLYSLDQQVINKHLVKPRTFRLATPRTRASASNSLLRYLAAIASSAVVSPTNWRSNSAKPHDQAHKIPLTFAEFCGCVGQRLQVRIHLTKLLIYSRECRVLGYFLTARDVRS